MLTAFVVVPLGTVLFEEVAFRGVLWGLLCSGRRDPGDAGVVRAVRTLARAAVAAAQPGQPGRRGTGRPGGAGQVLAVVGAVSFTAAAGVLLCELRRRSGSLLAPVALHWAVNGLGAVVAASVTR